jgi:hypothetical protein
MITIKELIQEEWADSIELSRRFLSTKKNVDIFKNPSLKEISEVANELGSFRFIAYHPTKTVYIFSSDTVHHEVIKKLNLSKKNIDYFDMDDVIGGEAVYKKDEKRAVCSDYPHNVMHGAQRKNKEIVKKDWNWINKYISIDNILKKLRRLYAILKEEYLTSALTKEGNTLDIFKNPTQSEIIKAEKQGYPNTKSIRWLADARKKTVWVFSNRMTHNAAAKELGLQYLTRESGNLHLLGGFAERDLTSWKTLEIHKYDNAPRDKKKLIRQQDWSFVEKYFISIPRKYLREEYETAIQHGKETIEIFKNPSLKEIKEVSEIINGKRYFRFIADGISKSLYIFSVREYHQVAYSKIFNKKYNASNDFPDNYIFGVAEERGNKFFLTTDTIRRIKRNKVDISKFSFLKKYFEIPESALKEEWHTSVKDSFSKKDIAVYDIFKNPSLKEIREADKGDGVRFIIDGVKKQIYVFDAMLLHSDAASALNIKMIYRGYSSAERAEKGFIFGLSNELKNGKLNVDDDLDKDCFNVFKKSGHSVDWLKKYFFSV